jgi:LPS-assembly protein
LFAERIRGFVMHGSYNSHALSRRLSRLTIDARPSLRLRPLRPPPALATCLLIWAAGALAEEPRLRLERALGEGRGRPAAEGAAYVRAERISGEIEERLTLEGNAEVRRAGTVLRGDQITYTVATDEIEATGNVRVYRDGVAFFGPSLKLRIDARTGAMPEAGFTYAPHGGRGTARRIEFLEGDRLRLEDAVYTTCAPGDDSWWIQARRLTLDHDGEVGIADDASVHFQGLPILASPYFQFPLGDRRRSGLLTPSVGINSKLGVEATVPYYWDIAPNYDATISPRVMTKRGLLLGNEFRYLEPNFRGTVEYDLVPYDRVTEGSRSYVALHHLYDNAAGLTGGINYNRVSDDLVLADYSRTIVGSSRLVLPQTAFLQYTQPHWRSLLRVEQNQTLQDPNEPVVKPHERVPQLSFSATAPRFAGFDAGVMMDATRFEHPTLESGSRFIVNPALAYPVRAPGYFLIPRVQWLGAWYELDDATRPEQRPSRTLPLASVDGGLVFERDARWFGEASVQTLEPRLFYAYVPYRDQSNLPVFDTAEADFNFTQLFRENRYSGFDRVSNDNQLTMALVGRVLDPASGAERLRGAIGQRFYFSSQEVTLPGGTASTGSESDLLFELRGVVASGWITDLYVQHSTLENRLVRAAAALRWQPRADSILSVAYRYKLDEIEQIDVAAAWPIAARWYGVGRANYSMRDSSWVELLAGFEYRQDCWAVRIVGQSFATPGEARTTSLLFQLQLNGVASIGTGVLDQLRRSIPGYQLIGAKQTGIGRYEDYE